MSECWDLLVIPVSEMTFHPWSRPSKVCLCAAHAATPPHLPPVLAWRTSPGPHGSPPYTLTFEVCVSQAACTWVLFYPVSQILPFFFFF